MKQRVARAIHASLINALSPEDDIEWDLMSDEERGPYLLAARRILHIMRIPTDAMVTEGNRGTARDAANVWEQMIFTALQE